MLLIEKMMKRFPVIAAMIFLFSVASCNQGSVDVIDPNFKIDVSDLSKFMRILYNATYLNIDNSEYAMTLLSQSSFTKGIVNGIPSDIKVAHKFGETGNALEAQLHETAIVYIGNDPYLITIMTKGKNVQLLPDALSGLSRITYEKMKS